VSGASSVSVDYPTQYAYVANGSSSVAIFAPREFEGQNDPRPRPPLEPRIWSSEEISFNRGFATLADGPFLITATGDLPITLELLDEGNLPLGITFVDNGDGTATVSGVPGPETEGDHAFAVTATNSEGVYAQALDITVQTPPAISSDPTTTFYAGSASSFTVFGTGYPTPIFYTWNEGVLEAAGVQLVDNEDGTASLVGTPTTPGPYEFLLEATSGCPPDAQQTFTLNVDEGPSAPAITSLNTATWAAVGAPFSPDPFTVTSIGSPTPALSVVTAEGQTGLPPGVTFIDNGDSTAMFGAACASFYPTMSPECLGLLEEGTQGEYTFTIQATNSEATTDQTFTLNLVHDTSLLGADPSTLSFATDGTYEPEAAVNLTTLGDVLPYAAVATADWLKTTPESGWMPGSITVSANAAGLAPGTYTGTVIVGSAGTEGPFATIAVTLEVLGVLEEGEVGVWPSALSFDYHVNDGITPPPQPVWVLSGGGLPLEYTVSIEGGKWLSAPASGTAPDGFLVYVDPGVGVGMHVANLTIDPDGEGEDDDSQTIPVTLVKTAGDADVIQIMLDVGEGPEGLTVDLNTHDVFITSSSGSAEAAEESGTAVEVPTTGPPEPQTVFHIDPLALTVEGETVVHSEGEYIAVNSTTGRVYQASEGTSELAVINGYTDEAVAFIPLTIPEGPCIPYQIAVDEAQNIIYVGAKSPEPEGTYPDPLIPDENGNYGCKAIRELPSDEAEPGQEELDCWHAGPVFVIDGYTNQVVSYFLAGDDPEGVVFAAATGKVYASNEDDGTITVAQGAVRNGEDSITPPYVIGTIIQGSLEEGWWVPTCDEHNYCGQRGEDSEEFRNLSLWPERSACYGIDDEAEEADKMTVDPDGNVYIIDDRYRVAKIDGQTDEVVQVIEIPGYDCEVTLPDDSPDVLRNTANNIAYMPLGQGKLYVVSEQNTISLIEWKYLGKRTLTNITTLTVPGASELDAITTDWTLNQVYVTDEELPALWILKGSCANGVGIHCVQ
jgi:DNA-binding beta-propeller fold protein YncE